MLATLKRPRDVDSPQQEPMGCSPHRLQLESPASKRTRTHAEAVAASSSSSVFASSEEGKWGVGRARAAPRPTELCLALPLTRHALLAGHRECLDWAISPHFPSHPLAGASLLPSDFSTALRQRIDPQTGEVLFTMDQVKDIVRRAVDEKERALREQYDRILATKLQGMRSLCPARMHRNVFVPASLGLSDSTTVHRL